MTAEQQKFTPAEFAMIHRFMLDSQSDRSLQGVSMVAHTSTMWEACLAALKQAAEGEKGEAPYRCSARGSTERNRWRDCENPGCPDGRDQPAPRYGANEYGKKSGEYHGLRKPPASPPSEPKAEPGPVADRDERILGALEDFSGMQPEADESWESWYHAAFELARDRVAGFLASPPLNERSWQPIETAPKDRTVIWAQLRHDIYPALCPDREDLKPWNGLHLPLRHPGLAEDGFDIGWSIAAPVGHGGFPDGWIAGWVPLPAIAQGRHTEGGL